MSVGEIQSVQPSSLAGCGLKHAMQFRVLRNKAYTEDGVHWYADPVPAEEGYHVSFRMSREPSPAAADGSAK